MVSRHAHDYIVSNEYKDSFVCSMSNKWECIVRLLELSAEGRWVHMNRVMRSVFELGAGDLVSKLETKNSVTFFRT